MKILAFDREATEWGTAVERALGPDRICGEAPVDCTLLTDSATLRPHEPLFVPDFARGWMLEVQPAITMQRLGKWIAPRFARRYFGDFRLCARLLPPSGAVPGNALECNYDGALAWGRPRPSDSLYDGSLHIEAMLSEGECPQSVTLRWQDLHAEETLALASRYMTLKTGDVIIPCRTSLRLPAGLNTRLRVVLNGDDTPDLNLKIK